MLLDALSGNEQYTSLCFIKFKFMDQTIIFIRRATFLFRGRFLKTFHTLYPQKSMGNMFSNIW